MQTTHASSAPGLYRTRMTDSYEERIDSLHAELNRLYRAGKPYDEVKAEGLWARIERLETMRVIVKGRS